MYCTLLSNCHQFEVWSNYWRLGGSAGAPRIGSLRYHHCLRQPHGNVHLAGAETALLDLGTMSGAVRSGRRAALQVLAALRPQSLSTADYVLLENSVVNADEMRQAILDVASGVGKQYVNIILLIYVTLANCSPMPFFFILALSTVGRFSCPCVA